MKKLCVHDLTCSPRPKRTVVLEGRIYGDMITTFGGTNSIPYPLDPMADWFPWTLCRIFPHGLSKYVTLGGPEGMLLTKSNSTERAWPTYI